MENHLAAKLCTSLPYVSHTLPTGLQKTLLHSAPAVTSCRSAGRWLDEARQNANPHMVIMLIGNKADLDQAKRDVHGAGAGGETAEQGR